MDGSFTVAYPSSWKITEEGVDKVYFGFSGLTGVVDVSFIEDGGERYSESDEVNVKIITAQVTTVWGDSIGWTGFKVIDKGIWQGDIYKGYFCEFISYGEELPEDWPVHGCITCILIGDDGVLVSYLHVAPNFTGEDYGNLEALLRSIRVK